MDFEMESAENLTRDNNDASVDLEWQVDSEWIDLSTSAASSGAKSKKGRKSGASKVDKNVPQNCHFIPTSQGSRFLVVENQTLRLSRRSPSGYSYWVCSIPCCNARCVLDPAEKITRYSGEHNHDADVSRAEYKIFINALKLAVKENPHVKPKVLYDAELERARERWKKSNKNYGNEDEPCLPSFDTVRTAMYNTRNAVLSSFSLKAAGDETVPVEVGKKSQAGPSRSTRSSNTKGGTKRKSTSAKAGSTNSTDLEELEEEWCNEPHKDANLSDFEEWLEDDVNANISSVVTPKIKAIEPQEEARIIMPLIVSPRKQGKDQEQPAAKKAKVAKEMNLVTTTSESDESYLMDGSMSADGAPRRKYRKRAISSSVFTCTHCPYKSNRHFNVQRHERLAHSTKKPEFSCQECGTSYSLEYRLKLHIKAVHQGEGHHCHICNRTFETMTGLKSHVVTKHKNEEHKVQQEPPPELTCKLCGRFFSTKSHLQKHTSTHVMVQPYRCFMCNEPFMEECSWLSHQNNCSAPFKIQCCLCSAVIPTPQELLVHMDTVHGRSEYSCTCGKTFPWKKSLLTHQQKCSLRAAERSA